MTQEAIEAEQATLLMRDDQDRIEHVKTVGADGDFERTLREHVVRPPGRLPPVAHRRPARQADLRRERRRQPAACRRSSSKHWG